MALSVREEAAAMMLHLTAQIWREGDAWVSWCPELDVASYGDGPEQARAMLHDAVQLTLDDMSPEEIAERVHPDTFSAPLHVEVPGDAA